MTKLNEVYKCNVCGNIVTVLHTGVGALVCCGEPMQLMAEKGLKDEGEEKHVPVIKKTKTGVKVLVGSAPHPIAKAILKKAKVTVKPTAFKNYPGLGIKCRVKGSEVLAGSNDFMSSNKISVGSEVNLLASKGRTVVIIAVNKRVIGLIGVTDQLKEGSKEAISELIKHHNVYMITGDNEATANSIASELGINNVLARVKPEDKSKKIRELKSSGLVSMIGDGVNDAPALAESDVGIAVGSGTDVAIETGDVVLVKDDLRKVLSAIKLSGKTMAKIKQNLFWAFIYNIIGLPIASLGLLNPVIAGIAMSLSSISVVSNSLLLRRTKL